MKLSWERIGSKYDRTADERQLRLSWRRIIARAWSKCCANGWLSGQLGRWRANCPSCGHRPAEIRQRTHIGGPAGISMTSMEEPGICRCGLSSNILAAASCDSASTIEYQLRSLRTSEIFFELTRFVFPRGAPESTRLF